MKRIMLFLFLLFSTLAISQDRDLDVPDLLKIKFNEEFKNVVRPEWSKVYRGELNHEARYEVTFYMDNSKYLVSYNNDGNIRVIERSLGLNEVKDDSLKYLKNFYPTYAIIGVTQLVKEDQKVFYEIVITNRIEYFELLFSKDGSFLEKRQLK